MIAQPRFLGIFRGVGDAGSTPAVTFNNKLIDMNLLDGIDELVKCIDGENDTALLFGIHDGKASYMVVGDEDQLRVCILDAMMQFGDIHLYNSFKQAVRDYEEICKKTREQSTKAVS